MARIITIKPVLNGFFCQIECTSVVVTSLNALCEGIREYYTDPGGTEKRWLSNGINRQGETLRQIDRDPTTATAWYDTCRRSNRSVSGTLSG